MNEKPKIADVFELPLRIEETAEDAKVGIIRVFEVIDNHGNTVGVSAYSDHKRRSLEAIVRAVNEYDPMWKIVRRLSCLIPGDQPVNVMDDLIRDARKLLGGAS